MAHDIGECIERDNNKQCCQMVDVSVEENDKCAANDDDVVQELVVLAYPVFRDSLFYKL